MAAGPMPVETIEELVRYRGKARFVRGNADRLMVESFDGAREAAGDAPDIWPASPLSRAHRDFLSGFEPVVELDVDGLGRVLFCHAGPTSDELPIITPATPDEVIAEALASTQASLVIAGHTHMQFDRQVAGRRMVNAGSVGLPYADQPGADWALLGPEVTSAGPRTTSKWRLRWCAAPSSRSARSWPEASSGHRPLRRRSPRSSAWRAGPIRPEHDVGMLGTADLRQFRIRRDCLSSRGHVNQYTRLDIRPHGVPNWCPWKSGAGGGSAAGPSHIATRFTP